MSTIMRGNTLKVSNIGQRVFLSCLSQDAELCFEISAFAAMLFAMLSALLT